MYCLLSLSFSLTFYLFFLHSLYLSYFSMKASSLRARFHINCLFSLSFFFSIRSISLHYLFDFNQLSIFFRVFFYFANKWWSFTARNCMRISSGETALLLHEGFFHWGYRYYVQNTFTETVEK